jgi:tetratricopeptide (TPR) repeat protein
MRLLTFISSVCLGVTCLVAGTESECALDALIESLEAHQTEGDWVNPQTISRIRRLDSLSRVEQQSPVCGDFDRWQTDTRKAAVLFLSLSKHFAEEDHDKLLALDLIEGSFNTLSAIKLRLQSAFDAFEWYDRLTNMLPFIQSRTALSHGQTTLLAMVSETLGKAQGKAVKEKAWTLAGRLLDEMDFKIADYGAVKSGFHSILIIYKQIEITEQLAAIHHGEVGDIKSFSKKIMKKVQEKQEKLREQLEEIADKRKEFVEFMGYGASSSWMDRDLAFEEIVGASTATEWFEQGQDANDRSEKIICFSKAIEIDPTFIAAFINRGVCYLQKDDHRKAIPDFTQALHLDPMDASLYEYRGHSYAATGSFEKAIRDYDRALQLEPNFARAFAGRAWVYTNVDSHDLAVEDLSKAIQLEPRNAELLSRRASSYAKLEKTDEAIKDYLTAIDVNPDFSSAYYNLGRVYWQQAKWKQVVTAWEKCLELDPGHDYIRKHLPQVRKWAGYRPE